MNVVPIYRAGMFRLAAPAVTVGLVIALISGCNDSRIATGVKVVSVDDGELTVVEENGLRRTTHDVPTDAEVTRDGEPTELEELKSGDAVNVKTEVRNGVEVVTEVNAESEEHADAEAPVAIPPIDAPVVPRTEEF